MKNASRQPIDQTKRQVIEKLSLERLAMAAIVRITGVSERCLQLYVNQKYDQTPKTVEITQKTGAVNTAIGRDVVVRGLKRK